MERDFNYDILELIKNRWSSRSFDGRAMTDDDVLPLLEAARYAPSAYNEQPWFFLMATGEKALKQVAEVLSDWNRTWAKEASAFIIILARKNFAHNNSLNRWHSFDVGTSFGFMAIEAEKRGIALHPMAGFDPAMTVKKFNVPSDYEPVAVVAAGFRDVPEKLQENIREREKPGLRNALNSIYRKV